MANPKHLKIVQKGVKAWNKWRKKDAETKPDLSNANLSGANLSDANLSGANLSGANLSGAKFLNAYMIDANLAAANLRGAIFRMANLIGVNLTEADLRGAVLVAANLRWVNLHGANLAAADLRTVNLHEANLTRANFQEVTVGGTQFTNLDLRGIDGLHTLAHNGPSTVGIDTLYKSGGHLPDVFLRGCGVPESLIEYQRSLVGAQEAIQYYACVISHSTHNADFATRLHSRMRDAQLRVWYAPADLKGGDHLVDQIDEAIKIFDKVIVVLSEASLQSAWVETEIRKAFRAERAQGKRKLFPIGLIPYPMLKEWELMEGGHDLAAYLRGFFIPDFSNWKNHDTFELAFSNLLRDLRA